MCIRHTVGSTLPQKDWRSNHSNLQNNISTKHNQTIGNLEMSALSDLSESAEISSHNLMESMNPGMASNVTFSDPRRLTTCAESGDSIHFPSSQVHGASNGHPIRFLPRAEPFGLDHQGLQSGRSSMLSPIKYGLQIK
jgi:hypothetical protein